MMCIKKNNKNLSNILFFFCGIIVATHTHTVFMFVYIIIYLINIYLIY